VALVGAVAARDTFAGTVLLFLGATREVGRDARAEAEGSSQQKLTAPPAPAALPACALAALRGHEGSLLPLIADFCGVVRGESLRNAREAARCLGAILAEADCAKPAADSACARPGASPGNGRTSPGWVL